MFCPKPITAQQSDSTVLPQAHNCTAERLFYPKTITAGAATIPIYSLITGWTPWKIVRRAGFAFFGIFNGTEYNESFEPEARQAVGSSSEVVIVCQVGGTLTPTQANPNGRQVRTGSLCGCCVCACCESAWGAGWYPWLFALGSMN